MKIAVLAFVALVAPLLVCWLFALCASYSWYRSRHRLLPTDIGEAGVEVTEGAQEVLVPGDRLYALREYVWIARGQHLGDISGDTLIDVTPPRDRGSQSDLRRIATYDAGPADAASKP